MHTMHCMSAKKAQSRWRAYPCLSCDPVALACKLNCKCSSYTSHGPSAVNQFRLLKSAAKIWSCGQTKRVKAVGPVPGKETQGTVPADWSTLYVRRTIGEAVCATADSRWKLIQISGGVTAWQPVALLLCKDLAAVRLCSDGGTEEPCGRACRSAHD